MNCAVWYCGVVSCAELYCSAVECDVLYCVTVSYAVLYCAAEQRFGLVIPRKKHSHVEQAISEIPREAGDHRVILY